jgi:hypothetical protein
MRSRTPIGAIASGDGSLGQQFQFSRCERLYPIRAGLLDEQRITLPREVDGRSARNDSVVVLREAMGRYQALPAARRRDDAGLCLGRVFRQEREVH